MSFWNDFISGVKDVGTSTVRIVTDTAIDLGNVVTGFQFNEEMEAAKKEMSDAGLLSAADAIEKNHYGFLKDMREEASNKFDRVNALFLEGKSLEDFRNQENRLLDNMCSDTLYLSQMSLEAQILLEQAQNTPGWEASSKKFNIPDHVFNLEDSSNSEWINVSHNIILTRLGSDISASALAGISTLAGISKASAALKTAKALRSTQAIASSASSSTRAATTATQAGTTASKFLKFGKLAGKASAVLTVVSIGLDIGLSVSQLEQEKDDLEKNLKELDDGIQEAQTAIDDIKSETREIQSLISQILGSVKPPQSRDSWDDWVSQSEQSFKSAREALVSFNGIRERAIKVARNTKALLIEQRISMVMSVDISIAREEAIAIIEQVDKTDAGSPQTTPNQLTLIKDLSWQATGPGDHKIVLEPNADVLTFTYGLSGSAVWTRQTWLFSAESIKTSQLTFYWKYKGFHAWHQPFYQISAFADGPEGRRYITLMEENLREASGSQSLPIFAGETFGFVIKGSNYDSDSRLFGDLQVVII